MEKEAEVLLVGADKNVISINKRCTLTKIFICYRMDLLTKDERLQLYFFVLIMEKL